MNNKETAFIKLLLTPALMIFTLLLIRWQYGVLLFHTLAELYSVMVGMLVLVIVWHTRQFTKNNFLMYLGIGYFWVAILDLGHVISVKGMPFFTISDAEITLHFWIYARLFEALILLSAPVFLLRKKFNAPVILIAGGFISLLLILASVFLKNPIMLTPEGLTTIKIVLEGVVVAILCVSIAVYCRLRDQLAPNVLYYLVASMCLTVLAELSFTLYADFSSGSFLLGHVFKTLSFWLIYRAIVETLLTKPFNMLAQVSNSYVAIPNPAVVVDSDAIISQVNRAAEELSGQSANFLQHKHVHDYFHQQELTVDDCKMCQAIKKGKVIKNQIISFADKKQSYLTSLVLLNVGDHHSGMVQSFTDITKQVLVERTLRKSNARFRQLFDKTDVISVQGYDKDRKVIYWNHASEILYGYSREQALGHKIEELIIPDNRRQQVVEGIDHWLQGGSAMPSSELTLKKSDGSMVQVYSSHVLFHNHANEVEMYCIDINLSEHKAAQNALVESEMMLDAITNQSIEGISVADTDGRYTFVNDAFCDMLGYSEEELLSMSVFDVKASGQDRSSFNESKTSKEGLPLRVLLQRKNNTVFMSEVIGKKIEIGGIDHVLGVIRDISDLVQKEQNIRILSQAVEQTPVAIVLTDTEGNIEYVNHSFELTTGYTLDEIKGKNPRLLKSGNTPVSVYKDLWNAITSGHSWKGEMQNRKKNGELFWINGHFAPVTNEEGMVQHYLAINEDISVRKQQQEQISHQAHFDTLTDLPNRFLSLDRLSQLLREAERYREQVAVLFLDLDDFKKINDTLGHATGDKLLIEVAARLSGVIRSEDTVGRLGGDEFLILLGGLKEITEAGQVAETILKRLTETFKIEDRELMVSASIGIAISPDDGNNPAELLRDADAAMYNAKALGRNTFSYFTNKMNKNLQRRLALEEQIHGALKRQEFSVFYQPQFDLSTGKIMGAEALLRWSNPILGNVSPNEFIPIAEQTGLIVAIGQFVLTEALRKTAIWQKNFAANFRIAINLSPAQFRDQKLVDFIEKERDHSGISSGTLELEITEGVLMSGHSSVDSDLARLSQLGISLAMDDFGTGYSSLSYLRNYPFDVLKIDKGFIDDINTDLSVLELINAAIAMAHSLNLKVFAEGVETQEQYDDLKTLGCDYAQGYLLGRPMPANEMTQFIKGSSTL